MTIEKPMRCCRQGYTILNNIWAIVCYRQNMRRLGFSFTMAVDDADAGNCAAIVVCG